MNTTTTVSGTRRNTQSLRIEKPPRIGAMLPTHVIILVLACVLWWIAKDMVATTRTLAGVSRVEFKLADELKSRWRLMEPLEVPLTLDVSGPTREINAFETEMKTNAGRYAYQFVVTQEELDNLTPDAQRQVTLLVDASKFQLSPGVTVPAELTIRLMAGDQRIRVVLEEYIEAPADIDLYRISGRIAEGYNYRKSVPSESQFVLFGPASEVNRLTDPVRGRALVAVAEVDINELLRTRAETEGLKVIDVLKRGSMVSQVPLSPRPGVEIRAVGGGPATDVRVQFTFERQTVVDVQRTLDIASIERARWMDDKKAEITGYQQTVPVTLQVSDETKDGFPDAVRPVIDLSHIKHDDVRIEKVGDGPRRRLRIAGDSQYVSLKIDAEKLTVYFDPAKQVTAARYSPISGEIVIAWDEP